MTEVTLYILAEFHRNSVTLSVSHQGVHDVKIYITSDVYFNHLVEMHSASFRHYSPSFPFVQ